MTSGVLLVVGASPEQAESGLSEVPHFEAIKGKLVLKVFLRFKLRDDKLTDKKAWLSDPDFAVCPFAHKGQLSAHASFLRSSLAKFVLRRRIWSQSWKPP